MKHTSKANKNNQYKTRILNDAQNYGGLQYFPCSTTRENAYTISSMFNDLIKSTHSSDDTRTIKRTTRSVSGVLNWSQQKGQPLPFESSLERDFSILCLAAGNVHRIISQPIKILYETLEGHTGEYTPDFQLEYSKKGKNYKSLVEIKYHDDLMRNKEKGDIKYNAARQWCFQNNFNFRIVTEKDIRSVRLENIKTLMRFSNAPSSNFIDLFLEQDIRKHLPCSIHDILDKFSTNREERAELQYSLWQYIFEGNFGIDFNNPIKPTSTMYPKYRAPKSSLFFDEETV
ncbi:TnsA endonuclease N-terminal domain-containing protein [Kordiimonas sp. SCSIO 12603]|uniref:TnsA endonuclease N-terminal domain-containing protein n=1 Tax=Kordiimonas sp. SCSIO 12603 TaxID=2829596 RepID=UPI002101F3E3|nr:TnsA endonuclease N-terminal domain-containing protein [Kordiimonas sp. SCSIO 12603]UTW59035.1 TnsA endonuclease N-terminal domain-containing protein [Kordiimonas sp. SCSIO 12603]